MKTLYMVKMGCDFDRYLPGIKLDKAKETAHRLSDIGNYRVRTLDECIPGTDGNTYFVEFIGGYGVYHYRTTAKRDGHTLKKPVWELANANGISGIDTEYTSRVDGCKYSNLTLESRLYSMNADYTKAGILAVVNSFSSVHYDNIEFVPR